MIVKHQNKYSLTDTAKINAQDWLRNNGPAIVDKIDKFFTTQAGTR